MRVLALWLSMLFIAIAAHAQTSGQETIMWLPGMDSVTVDGHLWLKMVSPGRGSVAAMVFESGRYLLAQVVIINQSTGAVDILPEHFIMTLTEPRSKPMEFIPPERVPANSGALLATMAKPGQILSGSLYFKREPSCASGCRVLLAIPVGDTTFLLPMSFGKRAPLQTSALAQNPPRALSSNVPPPSRQKNRRDWKAGKVLDSAMGEDEGGRNTKLLIEGEVYRYHVHDTKIFYTSPLYTWLLNRKNGCRFIVNETVEYAQEKDHLYVIDADGKECSVHILRQEKRQ